VCTVNLTAQESITSGSKHAGALHLPQIVCLSLQPLSRRPAWRLFASARRHGSPSSSNPIGLLPRRGNQNDGPHGETDDRELIEHSREAELAMTFDRIAVTRMAKTMTTRDHSTCTPGGMSFMIGEYRCYCIAARLHHHVPPRRHRRDRRDERI
jgi:hypothetical protein